MPCVMILSFIILVIGRCFPFTIQRECLIITDDYVEYYGIIRTYATMARVYLIDFNNSTIIMELLNSRSPAKKVFNIFLSLKFFTFNS